MNKNIKILVMYVGVAHIDPELVPEFIQKISTKLIPKTMECEVIIIPTHTYDTKVVCINPEFIRDEELINQHETLMREPNHNLQQQTKLEKHEKN